MLGVMADIVETFEQQQQGTGLVGKARRGAAVGIAEYFAG